MVISDRSTFDFDRLVTSLATTGEQRERAYVASVKDAASSHRNTVLRRTRDVLVVEDDPMLRETVCLALQDAGHQVDAAVDGAHALDFLRRDHYHVLLLDLLLPGMDGFAVMQILRAEPALRPPVVLVLSALQRQADVLAALEAGADDYLTKPFDLADLTLRLGMWLRRAGPAVPLGPPGLRVHTLGRFFVEHGGQIRLHAGTRPRKAVTLFIYLLTQHERTVHKGEVLSQLWPHTPDDLRATSLRTLLYQSRRLLGVAAHGPSWVQSSETTLALHLGPEDWWDVAEFTAWLAEGERWERGGEPVRARDAYAAGVALYHGDYLQEEPSLEWARALRARLREEWVRALSAMARLHGELGEYGEQEAVLRRVLQADPYREPDCRALMALLAAQGRKAEALLLYRELQAILRTALGASPARETEALAAHLDEDGPNP